MRVVVTGADGFAGRWLCRDLVKDGLWVAGWVRHLPRNPIEGVHYRIQDVRDRAGCHLAMKEDEPQQVFHLAALTHLASAQADPTTAHDTNIRGTHNVFSAMSQHSVGVLASTCHVYGVPQGLPITEEHPVAPTGVYASTKAQAEEAARHAASTVVIARGFHHTGPGQSADYALPGWAQQLAAGQSPIHVGDLSLKRDYTDVRDICRGYRRLARDGKHHGVYNLCSGQGTTLQDLLTGLNHGQTPAVQVDEDRLRQGDVPEFRGDPSKANALGWIPQVPQQQMLSDLRRSFDRQA